MRTQSAKAGCDAHHAQRTGDNKLGRRRIGANSNAGVNKKGETWDKAPSSKFQLHQPKAKSLFSHCECVCVNYSNELFACFWSGRQCGVCVCWSASAAAAAAAAAQTLARLRLSYEYKSGGRPAACLAINQRRASLYLFPLSPPIICVPRRC